MIYLKKCIKKSKTIDVVEQAEKQNEGVQLDTNQKEEKKDVVNYL